MEYALTKLEPFGVSVVPKGGKEDVKSLDLEFLRDLFQREQLVLLRGFRTFDSSKGFSDYCEAWGEISLWPFGKVLELIEQNNPLDHIFASSYVPLHWDGMYRPQVPEYQIFHCVTAPLPGHGGRTTFSNTILALEYAPAELKQMWNKVTGIYKRKMEFYDSQTGSPIVTQHPLRNFPVIRYSEPHSEEKGNFVNPPEIEVIGLQAEDVSTFHHKLTQALYAPANFYAHEWQEGDILIADNFSLLHGRERFVSKSPRHLQRVQVLSNPPLDNPGLEVYR